MKHSRIVNNNNDIIDLLKIAMFIHSNDNEIDIIKKLNCYLSQSSVNYSKKAIKKTLLIITHTFLNRQCSILKVICRKFYGVQDARVIINSVTWGFSFIDTKKDYVT